MTSDPAERRARSRAEDLKQAALTGARVDWRVGDPDLDDPSFEHGGLRAVQWGWDDLER